MPQQSAQRDLSITALGSGGVGKSALIINYMYDEFLEDYEPTKADMYTKKVNIGGEVVSFTLYDTAGQEEFAGILDSYIRSGDSFLLTFSVIDQVSLGELFPIFDRISLIKKPKPPMILVGNKKDLVDKRVISFADASRVADKFGIEYIETSAKTKENVDQVFINLERKLYTLKKERLEEVAHVTKKYHPPKCRCQIL